MSLRFRQPHTIVVIPMVNVRDRYGDWALTRGTPVTVQCAVQPLESLEAQALDVQVTTTRRVIGFVDWPGGPKSIVQWDGREWDCEGEQRPYRMGRNTKHFDVLITARTAEVK